jgi:hypothetical protein
MRGVGVDVLLFSGLGVVSVILECERQSKITKYMSEVKRRYNQSSLQALSAWIKRGNFSYGT